MKRIPINIILPFLAAAICGCERTDTCPDVLHEIRFDSGLCPEVSTKAMSERTSAAGFTCLALRSDGSTFIDNVRTTTLGSYQTVPGRYWPASGTLSFYGVLPNVSMTRSSGSVICPVGSSSSPLTGSEDYIVASRTNVSNATSPVSMQFSHILSQVSGLTLTGSRTGASTTVSSASFTHPTYGTYSLSTGSWSSTGGTASSSFSGFGTISGTGSGTASSDFSVIPGTYTLSVTYTVTSGGASRAYTKTGTFTLAAGKKSTVSATLSDDFADLSVSVSVAEWDPGATWTDDCADSTRPVSGGDTGGGSTGGPSCSVNLSAAGSYGWTESQYSVGGRTVYQSTNNGVGSSMAVMTMTIKGYTEFTFYAYASGESNYDYIAVSKPDTDLYSQIGSNGGWKSVTSQSSLSNMHTTVLKPSVDPEDPADGTVYVPVSFSGLSAGTTYTIQVIFGKDGSVDRGLDRGFIYIP